MINQHICGLVKVLIVTWKQFCVCFWWYLFNGFLCLFWFIWFNWAFDICIGHLILLIALLWHISIDLHLPSILHLLYHDALIQVLIQLRFEFLCRFTLSVFLILLKTNSLTFDWHVFPECWFALRLFQISSQVLNTHLIWYFYQVLHACFFDLRRADVLRLKMVLIFHQIVNNVRVCEVVVWFISRKTSTWYSLWAQAFSHCFIFEFVLFLRILSVNILEFDGFSFIFFGIEFLFKFSSWLETTFDVDDFVVYSLIVVEYEFVIMNIRLFFKMSKMRKRPEIRICPFVWYWTVSSLAVLTSMHFV